MNNYCTNCGQKLKSYVSVCNKCNTPVLDIPFDYKHEHPKKKKFRKTFWFVILGIVSFILLFLGLRKLYIYIMSNRLEKEYVIPFLEKEYGRYYSDLEFDIYGKCIVDGNCYQEPLISCDGNSCEVYTYLNRFDCMAFYYEYKLSDRDETRDITVYKKDGEYVVVRGRNIYGYDDEFSKNYIDEYDEEYQTIFIKEDFYKSEFILLDDEFYYKYIVQDDGELIVNSYSSGNFITNISSTELLGKTVIKTYDEFYEEIGTLEYEFSDLSEVYRFDDVLDNNVKYIRIFIGESYE